MGNTDPTIDATVIETEIENPAEGKDQDNKSLLYSSKFYKHFFLGPCRCCGSNKHGLLIRMLSKKKKVRYTRYSCPVLGEYPDPATLSELEILTITHLACPIRMTRHYNYERNDIIQAMLLYRTQGTGRFLLDERYKTFKKIVFDVCYSQQSICRETDRYKSLVVGDCAICGNDKHSALAPYLTGNGMVTYHYVCPVAANENWEEATQFKDTSRKYRICPSKLAKECDYSFTMLFTALDSFKLSSASKRWSTNEIGKLEFKASQVCEQYHLNKTTSIIKSDIDNQYQPWTSKSIYNLIRSLIHNLIDRANLNKVQIQIYKFDKTFDRSLIWPVIHNLIIVSLCIFVIYFTNVSFQHHNKGYSL
jgi:hypothetical protein